MASDTKMKSSTMRCRADCNVCACPTLTGACGSACGEACGGAVGAPRSAGCAGYLRCRSERVTTPDAVDMKQCAVLCHTVFSHIRSSI
jgi:hypothetical protein